MVTSKAPSKTQKSVVKKTPKIAPPKAKDKKEPAPSALLTTVERQQVEKFVKRGMPRATAERIVRSHRSKK